MDLDPKLIELLLPYPVIIQLPVQWGDMDANSHVNNVSYLQWVESARIAYFEQIDFFDFTGSKPGPILKKTSTKYIYPLFYPDLVWLGSRAKQLQADRFILETAVFSNQHKRIAAISQSEVVIFDYHKKSKIEMPPDVRDRIFMLEASVNEKDL